MLPIPEGYSQADRTESGQSLEQLLLTKSVTLTDLARDYAIFTHAAFFVHGGMDVDPVADYAARQTDLVAVAASFGRHLFGGLGDDQRAATLLFSPHAAWPALRDVLRTCSWVDRVRGNYTRATMQEARILDFLAMDRATVLPHPLPTVPITLFAVNGTHTHMLFAVDDPLMPFSRPTIVRMPILAETVALGRAFLGESATPFRAIESEDPFAGQKGVVLPAP